MGNQENVVIYDWISFTSKVHSPEHLIAALGLSHCPWTETRVARGYMDRLYFGCISIHYNGRDKPTVIELQFIYGTHIHSPFISAW